MFSFLKLTTNDNDDDDDDEIKKLEKEVSAICEKNQEILDELNRRI